jgi:hypothetical protein
MALLFKGTQIMTVYLDKPLRLRATSWQPAVPAEYLGFTNGLMEFKMEHNYRFASQGKYQTPENIYRIYPENFERFFENYEPYSTRQKITLDEIALIFIVLLMGAIMLAASFGLFE